MSLLESIGWSEEKAAGGGVYYFSPTVCRCTPEPPLYEILGLSSDQTGYARLDIFRAYCYSEIPTRLLIHLSHQINIGFLRKIKDKRKKQVLLRSIHF